MCRSGKSWLAVVALVGLLLVSAGCKGDEAGTPVSTGDPSPAAGQQEIAQRFAPLVWLSGGEKYQPMDTGEFIAKSELWFDQPCPEPPATRRLVAEVDQSRLGGRSAAYTTTGCDGARVYSSDKDLDGGEAGGKGFFLDLADDDAVRHGDASSAPVYWESFDKGDDHTTAVVYWLFYGYDDFVSGGVRINTHEGDWERVAVQLRDGKPFGMTFWRHNEPPCLVDWDDLETSDGHPVAYSAVGSHASYHRAGGFDATPANVVGVPIPGSATPITDITSPGTKWPTWERTQSVTQTSWWGYKGGWGNQIGRKGNTGPRGPYPGRTGPVFATETCADPLPLPTATPGPSVPSDSSVPAEQYRQGSFYYFKSADDTYGCGIAENEALCQGETQPLPPRPASCRESWGDGMFVDTAGKSDFVCAGGLIYGPSGRNPEPRDVLPPGSSITALGFTCAAEDGAIRCTHDASGHGFHIAADSNEQF
jgi:Vacuolar protein sorting-associated protein 62